MSNGFVTSLEVRSVDPTTWMLTRELMWIGKQDDVITVPAGETTDFATVPQILQSFTPRTGAWTKAAVIHDHLCRRLNEWEHYTKGHGWADQSWPLRGTGFPTFNAVDTDNVFRLIMVEDGVPRWRAEVMWAAVRWAALANPARRPGWWDTAPRVLGISLLILLPVLTVLVGLATLAAVVIPL